MRTVWMVSCSAMVAMGGAGLHRAQAAAITLGDPNGYLIVDQRSANSLNRRTGERIVYGETSAVPNGAAGTTAMASTTNTVTGAVQSFALPFTGSPALPNQFSSTTAYSAGLTGPWTLTFTNGSDSRTVTTPSIVGVTPPPYAGNVAVSGSSANPTFSWSYPTGSVQGVFFDLFDKSVLDASGGAALVYSKALGGTTNSFTVPNALAGGLTLQPDHLYTLDLYGVVTRDGTTTLTNANSAAWSESYFDFRTSSTASAPVNLPILTGSGAYQFSMAVVAGTTYYIDPAIATGYDYATAPGDANFASVTLPTLQGSAYDLSYSFGNQTILASVAPGTAYLFPTGGVSNFRVTGIDPALGLDPSDTTAFVTALTFAASGTFDGTQTPIVTTVAVLPEPPSLFLAGIAVLGGAALRRRPAACA